MQNKRLSIPPAALVTVVGSNILAPASTTEAAGVGYTSTKSYILFRHMRAHNSAVAASVISLYRGALLGSAAGTEFAWSGVSIPGNSYLDWYGECKIATGETAAAITGSCNPATCTLDFDNAEIGFL